MYAPQFLYAWRFPILDYHIKGGVMMLYKDFALALGTSPA
jgi:hypothetical protein